MDSFILIKALSIIAALLATLYGALLLIKKRQLYDIKSHGHDIALRAYKKIDTKTSVALVEVDGMHLVIVSNGVSIALKRWNK